MSRYVVIQDADKCDHCGACLDKCMKANRFPARVRMAPPERHHATTGAHLAFLSCHHCEEPTCVAACPHGAMELTADGVARVIQESCQGCSACAQACPWHVPRVLENAATVKCTLCDGRAARGKTPVCVLVCPRKALRLVRVVDLAGEARSEHVRKCILKHFLTQE